MTRYHTTADGNVPFTPEEEATWDAAEEAANSIEAVRGTALLALAAIRYAREVAGVTVGEWAVQTDRESRAELQTRARRGTPCDWKLACGTWVTLSASAVASVAQAVDDYAQACFARERALSAAIAAAADVATLAAIDLAAGWPATEVPAPPARIGVDAQRARDLAALAESDPDASKVVEVLRTAGLI